MSNTTIDFKNSGGKAAKCGYCGGTKGNQIQDLTAVAPRPTRQDILDYLKANAPK